MKQLDNLGFFGVILIQAATFPLLVDLWRGDATVPPVMPALLAVGMACLLVRAIACRDVVNGTACALGTITNTIALALVL